MSTSTGQTRNRCLACVVLDDSCDWLGSPSPIHLDTFLNGAHFRAGLTEPQFPVWRIFGPLRNPEFSTPLVARTGHPTLTIRWPHALEMVHFRVEDAMTEPRTLTSAWFDAGRFDAEEVAGQFHLGDPDPCEAFWQSFFARPGMYLGNADGWRLYCFLQGMARGGDWLELPPMPRLREIVDDLGRRSREAYGSDFAAFRVYGATGLFEWVKSKLSANDRQVRRARKRPSGAHR